MALLMLAPAIVALVVTARPGVATSVARLRGKSLILLAAGLQLAHHEGWWPAGLAGATERRLYALTVSVLAVGFCLLNRELADRRFGRAGLLLIPVGTVLNAIPIVALGAMPFSATAALNAGYTRAEAYGPILGYVRLDQVPPWWTPVADVVPLPVLEKVVSIGDLLLLPGLALLLLAACAAPQAVPDRSALAPTTGGR
jgi:hypothetical protein